MSLEPQTFVGGQMTQLPAFTLTALAGTELFEIVSPGTVSNSTNYAITSELLGQLLQKFWLVTTAVTIASGATPASPYIVPITVSRALFDKTVGAASGAQLGLASTYYLPVLIKDLKGDASINNITISFTGGELCEGLSTLTITTDYGYYWLNPIPGGGGWYIG